MAGRMHQAGEAERLGVGVLPADVLVEKLSKDAKKELSKFRYRCGKPPVAALLAERSRKGVKNNPSLFLLPASFALGLDHSFCSLLHDSKKCSIPRDVADEVEDQLQVGCTGRLDLTFDGYRASTLMSAHGSEHEGGACLSRVWPGGMGACEALALGAKLESYSLRVCGSFNTL